MAADQWWFNLKTHTVEQDAKRDKSANRLGPYPSREAAEGALEKVAERNETADRQDDWGDEAEEPRS